MRENWVNGLYSEYENLYQANQYEKALLPIWHIAMIYIETYGHQMPVIPYLEKEAILLDKIGRKEESQTGRSLIKDIRLGKIK